MQINPFTALSSVGGASTDNKTIAQNFNTFLSLLTTQLQNQNPLDPLDTNQFTQQLVQFTSVEQAVKTNENLETLAKLSAASAITGAVGYIGKEVTAEGSAAQLTNGSASWKYSIASDSPSATITIRDANGNEVFSENRPLSKGSETYTWDGRTSTGGLAPDGAYTLSIRATDGNNGSIAVSTQISGIVEGVDMSGSEPVLIINGRELKLTEIVAIRQSLNSKNDAI